MRCSAIILTLILASVSSASLRGDGGEVRYSDKWNGYRVAVFTAPTPLRVGPVDVGVLVLDETTGQPAAEARVVIHLKSTAQAGLSDSAPATFAASTNKLIQSAWFEIPVAGRWEMLVDIATPRGQTQARFEVDVAEPMPRWREFWVWIALPVVPIGLFALHLALTRRGRRPVGPPQGRSVG